MTGPDDTGLADEHLAPEAAYAEECEANRLDRVPLAQEVGADPYRSH